MDICSDFTEAFHLFDIENEGFINPRKLFSALIMLGYHPTEAEIQDLIGSVDKDGTVLLYTITGTHTYIHTN